jgi:hypothetical protein
MNIQKINRKILKSKQIFDAELWIKKSKYKQRNISKNNLNSDLIYYWKNIENKNRIIKNKLISIERIRKNKLIKNWKEVEQLAIANKLYALVCIAIDPTLLFYITNILQITNLTEIQIIYLFVFCLNYKNIFTDIEKEIDTLLLNGISYISKVNTC